ncbi:host specificity protein J [Hyphomonas sp.]|uniref:host specificity protein J n=1 Tax=Hyphomonas sp. TaxID=87 RepID=UPI000C8BBDD7|nr:phage tail protein [Hyphomonas sp.]MAL47041.1 hypothetical protein [Hyphomonas sp.]
MSPFFNPTLLGAEPFASFFNTTNPDLPADTLSSKQFQTLIDLISEGVISGFPSATGNQGSAEYNTSSLKDVFLNGTQVLQQSAGTSPDESEFNFKNITFEPRFGTSNQTAIAGISASESETAVGVTVTKASPVSRSITDTNVDAVRVTVAFPQLQKFEDNGDINGASVGLTIQTIENDGTTQTVITDTVTGRAASTYFRDYKINLPSGTSFPVTIRVNRTTDDSTETTLQNSFQWSSFTEIINESRAYADSAHVAIRFDAETFPSVPSRMYRVRGTLIKIPHNGSVRADGSISYNGTFNGTFKTSTGTYSQSGTTVTITISNHGLAVGDVVSIEYTSGSATDGDFAIATKSDANTFTVTAATSASNSGNVSVTLKEYSNDPAWVLYDLLTTSKGLGDHIDTTQLDVYSFYSASVYCSEQVDDMTGTGNTEARFSTNVVLNTQRDAYSLINDLCSVMRVMPFYSAGVINISQDRPQDASYIYNLSNVTAEGFSYSNASKSTKATVVNVGYFDNETQSIDYETVEDSALRAKYGVVVRNLKAFATTSRGQAARLGKWFLYTQSNESEIVSFKTTIESGVIVRVGTVISIQDPMKAGLRRGGRIKTGVSTTQIVVDDTNNTNLPTDGNATLSVILSDGTMETKSINAVSGSTITVSSAFSSVPQTNSVWVIENDVIALQTFRVFSVKEVNGFEYEIQAVAHNPQKYSSVEDGSTLQTRNISVLTDLKDAPSDLRGTEQIVVLNNRAVSKLFIQWQPVAGVTEYMVQYRFKNENFITQRVNRPDFTIFETELGTYQVRVFSYNALGKPSSQPSTTTFTTVGKTALPEDVQNIRLEPISDQFVRLRFDQSTSVDVVHGGNVVIRSSNLITGSTFTNSVDVLPALSGNVSESIVPNIVNGTYHLKFKDDGGRLSAGDASIPLIQTVPNAFPKLTVLTDREDLDSPPFQGEKNDCFFSTEVNGLVLASQSTLDNVADFDSIPSLDFLGAVDLTGGQYTFANTLDLGAKQPLRLRRHIVSQGFYPLDLFDARTANIDTWTDFDSDTAFDVNAELLVATTDSDPDTSTAGTYAISGTTITITKSSHGYSVGSFVAVNFTSGTGVDGDYEIKTIPNANTFTLTSATSLSTSGNCTFSAEFSQFNPFVNGTFVGRGFKFRCDMSTNDPAQSIEIDQLGYTAEIESRTETSLGNSGATNGVFASGTSTKSVVFSDSFFTGQTGTSIAANSVLPSIGITIENAQSGDFFTLSNITGSGFDIDILNSGSNVNRNFKYTATGFGRAS